MSKNIQYVKVVNSKHVIIVFFSIAVKRNNSKLYVMSK